MSTVRSRANSVAKFWLLFFIVCLPVFTVSCVSTEVPVTETYYETESRTESYTTIEDVGVNTEEEVINLTPITKWENSYTVTKQGFGIGLTYYSGYRINQNTSKPCKVIIRVNLAAGYISVYNLTGMGQIVDNWDSLSSLNALAKNSERVLYSKNITEPEINFDATGINEFAIVANTLSKYVISTVQLVYPSQTVTKQTVTKERQVPYQVEKQRVVMQTKKVPFWEAWQKESRSSLPEASPTLSEPPASPSTTSTAESTVSSSGLLYEDDFSTASSGFGNIDTADYIAGYEDGEYHIRVKTPFFSTWRLNTEAGSLTDFALEIDARLIDGYVLNSYGVIFRAADNNNFYCFIVSGYGSYRIQKVLDGKWSQLTVEKQSPNIPNLTMNLLNKEGGKANHLKVICKGAKIDVYANDSLLTTIMNESFTSGYCGLIVNSNESPLRETTESNTHVAFDDLKVYSPD